MYVPRPFARTQRDKRFDRLMYATLIAACETGDVWMEAVHVHAKMRAAGLEPVAGTYGSLINACAKGMQVRGGPMVFGNLNPKR